MQSRHGQFSGFHFFICILKAAMLLAFFNLSGKMFQILGPRNEILSSPCSYWRYSKLGILSEFVVLLIPLLEKFCEIKWDRSFFILYISVTRIWRFRLWTETEPCFSNSVSNDERWSKYIIPKQRSRSLLFCYC